MNKRQIQIYIDRAIKETWLQNISVDYESDYLLKEDSLKNAIYYHLRTRLQHVLEQNNLRIFTEYHYKGFIADMAIVQLSENLSKPLHLKDKVQSVLAILEVKYKNGGNVAPFEEDIKKIQRYIDLDPFDNCQFYLAFIHEMEYDSTSPSSWLTDEQKMWAKGRLTELSGFFHESEPVWEVFSHHELNPVITRKHAGYIDQQQIIEFAEEFNEDKYSHEFYHYYLDVIKDSDGVTDNLKEAVTNLFFWKLGKVSRKPTHTSRKVIQTQLSHTYIINGTTGANQISIDTALQESLLQAGMNFKNGLIGYEDFVKLANEITKTSIVLPVFYVHIFKPETYPILDVRVWRAYLFAMGKTISKNSKPMSWKHYGEYRQFFDEIQEQTKLPARLIDKGLWVMGDWVNVSR